MNIRSGLWAFTVALLSSVGAARGQAVAPATTQTPASMGSPLANPFLNSSMNPYLNPYLSTTNTSSDAALMYLLAAQRQTGGIGSGVISGVRQAETGARPARASAAAPAASAPTASSPYGGEAGNRYFQRGQGRFGGRAGSYFQRMAPRTGR